MNFLSVWTSLLLLALSLTPLAAAQPVQPVPSISGRHTCTVQLPTPNLASFLQICISNNTYQFRENITVTFAVTNSGSLPLGYGQLRFEVSDIRLQNQDIVFAVSQVQACSEPGVCTIEPGQGIMKTISWIAQPPPGNYLVHATLGFAPNNLGAAVLLPADFAIRVMTPAASRG